MTLGLPWTAQALCAQTDGDAWFPDTPGPNDRIAKEICGRCPVKPQCLHWALTHHEHGIWGGKTARQRKDMRRELGITATRPPQPIAHGTEAGARTHFRRGETPCRPCQDAANAAARQRHKAAR